jgi:dTDP-4-amino-4,6-dideoxygalactose transaminase
MDSARRHLLGRNISEYQHPINDVQEAVAAIAKEAAGNSDALIDLPAVCGVQPPRRLLRYPLLVQTGWRDRIYQRLRKAGLGPSILYPSSLPGIQGLEELVGDQGDFPAAEAFAGRMLTIPTHDRVSGSDIQKIRELLVADNGVGHIKRS